MSTRKMFRKRGRWYGDFRGFAAYGGRTMALKELGERTATLDRRRAEALYDELHREFLSQRIKHTPPAHQPPQAGTLTLERCVKDWIEAYRGVVASSVTRDRYRYLKLITTILPPSMPARELTRGTIMDFLAFLRERPRRVFSDAMGEPPGRDADRPYSSNYRRKLLDVLQMALDHAVAYRKLEENPARNLPRLLVPKMWTEHETNFYAPEEAGLILSALSPLPDGTPPGDWPGRTSPYVFEQVAFALLTGARCNEMQSQRWEWVDWERGIVNVYTSKRQRGEERSRIHRQTFRPIPLWPQLRAILERLWCRQGKPATGLLWPQLHRGTCERIHIPPGPAALPGAARLPGELAGVSDHLLRHAPPDRGARRRDAGTMDPGRPAHG